jgi:hypothetical protein
MRRNALENKLIDDPDSVVNLIDDGQIQDAIDKLNNDIGARVDGSLDGNPNNDWITDLGAQETLTSMVDGSVDYLEDLL